MDVSDRQSGGNGHREALHFSHPPKRVVSLVPSTDGEHVRPGFWRQPGWDHRLLYPPERGGRGRSTYWWSEESTDPGYPGFETGPDPGRLGRKYPRLGGRAGRCWSGGLGHLSEHSPRINGDPLDAVQVIQEPDGAGQAPDSGSDPGLDHLGGG